MAGKQKKTQISLNNQIKKTCLRCGGLMVLNVDENTGQEVWECLSCHKIDYPLGSWYKK